jgi:5S rRNA maturation endonuclease (ribonuclease M5)
MYNSGEYSFKNKDAIKNILLTHGYPVSESSNYLNTAALWRSGQDPKSVAIYWGENLCLDFVEGSKFDIKRLISLVTNQLSTEDLEKYLQKNNIVLPPPSPKIKQIKIFSDDIFKSLVPIYDYWESRGISKEVLQETRGGVFSDKGILKGKYVFPVLNSKNQITMLAGRDINGNNKEWKWILRGSKSTVYPLFLNNKDIKEKKEIILVEGISDVISFLTCGIRTSVCMFGTECGLPIINYLLKIQDVKIIIATNNDNAGLNSANKAYKRLSKYFDSKQIKIKLPKKPYKDFNEQLMAEGKDSILEWYKN